MAHRKLFKPNYVDTKIMELLWKRQKKEGTILTAKDGWIIPELKEKETNKIEYSSELGITVSILKDIYTIEEPNLSEEEKRIIATLNQGLYELLNFSPEDNAEDFLDKSISIILSELDLRISEESFKKVYFYIHKEFIGLGKIEAIKRDPLVTTILYKGKEETIQISHRLYGNLNTNILLSEEERETILKHILIAYNKDFPEEKQEIICEDEKGKWKILWNGEKKAFLYTKKVSRIYSPIELVLARKISPEMLAYLWMLMEDKRNIFINNEELLYALSFFLPEHAKVSTNTEEYLPNKLTITTFGKTAEQDYSFIKSFTKETECTGCILATTQEEIKEEENIICYTEKEKITSLKEQGKELFSYRNNKFVYNLDKSSFFSSKENKVLLQEEWKERTKLLTLLIKNKIPNEDFKKIIAIYYQNPKAVLKKAGLQ